MNTQSNADRALELYLDWCAAGRREELPQVDFVLTDAERGAVNAAIQVAELLVEYAHLDTAARAGLDPSED